MVMVSAFTSLFSRAPSLNLGQQLDGMAALSAAHTLGDFNLVVEAAGDVMKFNGEAADEFVPQDSIVMAERIRARGIIWANEYFDRCLNTVAAAGNVNEQLRRDGVVPEKFPIYVKRRIVSQRTVDNLIESGMMVDSSIKLGVTETGRIIESFKYSMKYMCWKDKLMLGSNVAAALLVLFEILGWIVPPIGVAASVSIMGVLWMSRFPGFLRAQKKHMAQYVLANRYEDPES